MFFNPTHLLVLEMLEWLFLESAKGMVLIFVECQNMQG